MDDLRHLTHFICSRLPAWPLRRTSPPRSGVLVLTGRDIAALMRAADYRRAVEAGFAAAGEGAASSPAPMHVAGADGGAFHVKGARLAAGGRDYAAFKVNGNFPDNSVRRGLPTIQGALVLCDAANGAVLALMDSIEVTLQRTAAATAVAAERLARKDSASIAICGCGAQARVQLEALRDVLPLRRGHAWDADPARAEALARDASGMGLAITPTAELAAATLDSDVIVTCTTATTAFLGPDHVAPGTFIAAVGADSPGKSEIAPALMARATVVADVLEQCLAMGDLRHALAAGVLSAADVHAELAEVVSGRRPGRTRVDEITLFDSTGTAIQDVASAAVIYQRALAAQAGLRLNLGGRA